jgi:hypothetical protein
LIILKISSGDNGNVVRKEMCFTLSVIKIQESSVLRQCGHNEKLKEER